MSQPPPVEVWCIPLNLTEGSLHTGSILARRLPEVLARLLSRAAGVRAAWAPLVVQVEEGLGHVVTVATADDTESRRHLAELEGEYLVFGQLDLTGERLWLDARLYSRRRDETLLYLPFSGSRAAFVEWLPSWAAEIARALRGTLPPEATAALQRPPTLNWEALRFYCNALDFDQGRAATREHPAALDPELESQVVIQVCAALEQDPTFEWAAELGAAVASRCLEAGQWEHAEDLLRWMQVRSPESPALATLEARLRARFGGAPGLP